jgi:hypothetical protein
MAATLAAKAVRRPFRPSFFFWITAAMAFLVFGGFGLTYWQPMAAGNLVPLPPVVHLHGFLFSFWMLLLLTQSFLINVNRVALHRTLGTFGIAVAAGLLITGALITLLFGSVSSPAEPEYHDLMYLGLAALAGFGTLFSLAIRQVRRPDNHRRLILLATIPLLPPGINRLYMVSMGLTELPLLATYLTMDALAAAILLYDRRTLGRFSRASIVGAAVVLALQLLHVPIAGSEAFAGFSRFLTDLVYYR